MTQITTLDALIKKAEDYASDLRDFETNSTSIAFSAPYQINYRGEKESDGIFGKVHEISDEKGDLNNHAFGQLAERLNAPPMRWLGNSEKCPPELRETIMNKLVAVRGNEQFLVRHKGNTIRAVVSDTYSVFDNLPFLRLIEKAINTLGAEVKVHRGIVGDTLRAYLVLPHITFDAPDGGKYGGLHPALYVSNSEIATGKARATGGLYRSICANGTIYGWKTENSLAVRHRFIQTKTMYVLVADAIAQGLKMSEQAAKAFVASYEVHLKPQSLAPIVNKWAAEYGITVDAKESWLSVAQSEAVNHGRKDDPRKADLVNALTYVSQGMDEIQRETMERMAGDMLGVDLPTNHVVYATLDQ